MAARVGSALSATKLRPEWSLYDEEPRPPPKTVGEAAARALAHLRIAHVLIRGYVTRGDIGVPRRLIAAQEFTTQAIEYIENSGAELAGISARRKKVAPRARRTPRAARS